MKPINSFLDFIRDSVKRIMKRLASLLNKLSGGRLSPNAVTLTGLLVHIGIAWLISQGDLGFAAILLAIFGLFDSLDGELARLQGKDGPEGMLLDSITDRMKEVLLYIGVAYLFVASNHSFYAAWAVAACGGSLLVSYVNAWGEAVAARFPIQNHTPNNSFRGSLMRFEVRMFVLVVGLAVNRLDVTTVLVAVLAWFTAYNRLMAVRKRLGAV